jgi:hypothetical protein
MRVDEAGRDHEIAGVDDGGGALRHPADFGDLAARDRHVGPPRRAPVPSTSIPFLITRS